MSDLKSYWQDKYPSAFCWSFGDSPALADELAATEIYEDEGTDPEDLQSLLISFGELAQLAESLGQVLYVRITIVLEQDE